MMRLLEKYPWLEKYKFQVLLALLAIIGLGLYFSWGQDAGQTANKNVSAQNQAGLKAEPVNMPKITVLSATPVMPRGFKKESSWRDPFAPPGEVAGTNNKKNPDAEKNLPVAAVVARANDSSPGPEPKPANDLPALLGIVKSAKNSLAIIRSKEGSRAYHVGELVGDYKLEEIGESSVVLSKANPENKNMLGMKFTIRM